MYELFVDFVKNLYGQSSPIPLHEPVFVGNEKKYINECIDSTYVSSIGDYVGKVEKKLEEVSGARYAIVTVNGTSALHLCLLVAGVQSGDEIITQPLTFVATCNAISYCSAQPVFVDVDRDTMGMSPDALRHFLESTTYISDGRCINRVTKRPIRACIPMHTFGHPCKIDIINEICRDHHIVVIQDAAESLGSEYKGKKLASLTDLSAVSFNGNKIVTSGGGGAVLTNNEKMAENAKHLSTTARKVIDWNYIHDTVAYNYRMPNINAALLLAQLEKVDHFIESKRNLAKLYQAFFDEQNIGTFIVEPDGARSNYWLNSVQLFSKSSRDDFLNYTNSRGILTRGVWVLMNKLQMYKNAYCAEIPNAENFASTIVNIPSSVRSQ